MVLLEFSMAPVGQGESMSAQVARVIDVIDRSGLPYQLTPMGTIVEGEWAECMALVTRCFATLQADSPRVSVQLRADYRAGPAGRLKSKTARIEERTWSNFSCHPAVGASLGDRDAQRAHHPGPEPVKVFPGST
jgi:uncharacterized protein (TIGR00106 family)